MNSTNRFHFWAVVVGLLAFSPAVHAEGGPFSIGARGVLFTPEDGDSSWSGGAQARLRLPLFFGAEASADYRRSEFDDSTIHDQPIQLSGLVYLPKILQVQPLFLVGVGWYRTTVKGPNGFDDTQTRFGPHAGAGVEFNLSSSWFLDATYRYVWLDEFDSIDPNNIPQTFEDSGHMITFGVNYRI